MGTRGFVGVSVDGNEKLAYQQFDSYPSGVGLQALAAARKIAADPQTYRSLAQAVRLVDEEGQPTPDDYDRYAQYRNASVNRGQGWYSLLRELQGDLLGYLHVGVMADASTFPLDSLFCEWGYLVDLDEGTFEVYRGFQKTPHDRGRFAGRIAARVAAGEMPDPMAEAAARATERYQPPAYYEVALEGAWMLSALPSDEAFLAELEAGDA